MENPKSEFANFRGWFNLIEVDTNLYKTLGKMIHQTGRPIRVVDEIVRQVTGKKLILATRGPFHNLMVETGRELHAHLMINDLAIYDGHVVPAYIHCGSGTTAPTIDDWKLETPWGSGGKYAIATAEILDGSHCRWEATMPSGDSGTLGEAGLFLQNSAPTANPQDDPTQRPYSMLHRALFTPPVVKSAGFTEVLQYEAIF